MLFRSRSMWRIFWGLSSVWAPPGRPGQCIRWTRFSVGPRLSRFFSSRLTIHRGKGRGPAGMEKPLVIFEMANNHMGDVAHGSAVIRAFADVAKPFHDTFRFAFKLQYRDLDSFIHRTDRATGAAGGVPLHRCTHDTSAQRRRSRALESAGGWRRQRL